MKRTTKQLAIGVSSGILGSAAYLYHNEEERYKTKLVCASAIRITTLLTTVIRMATDYGYHYYWKQKDISFAKDRKENELMELQSQYEKIFAQYTALTTLAEERQRLQSHVHDFKSKIGLLASSIHQLEEARDKDNSALHLRNAGRLRDMCAANGGLYIKLGQHLAMLDHILPIEYQETLRSLLHENPSSSIDTVEHIFRTDFGVEIEHVFDSFEPIPIASASLAQVHIAWKDKKKYAVKIQHEGLLESSAFDRLVITFLVDLIPLIFPSFNYSWLTKEMNRNLPLELDFRQEVENIEQCRRILTDAIARGDVALPEPNTSFCSQRVLTMSFEEGFYVHKIEQGSVLSSKTSQIAHLVSSVFSEQIFRHGFVHCDPHEANLLVREHPSIPGKPQLVLLDHGLYRRLTDSFRRDYCRLWQAIILSDEKGIEKYCKRMNAGAAYPLLVAMLTLKPWDDVVSSDDLERLHNRHNATEEAILRSYAKKYFGEIVNLLGLVPSDLLLLFKTNDCLRHIDKALGTPVNTTAVVADIVSNVILEEDLSELREGVFGWSQWVNSASVFWTYLNARGRLLLLDWIGVMLRCERAFDHYMAMVYRAMFHDNLVL